MPLTIQRVGQSQPFHIACGNKENWKLCESIEAEIEAFYDHKLNTVEFFSLATASAPLRWDDICASAGAPSLLTTEKETSKKTGFHLLDFDFFLRPHRLLPLRSFFFPSCAVKTSAAVALLPSFVTMSIKCSSKRQRSRVNEWWDSVFPLLLDENEEAKERKKKWNHKNFKESEKNLSKMRNLTATTTNAAQQRLSALFLFDDDE